MLRALGRTEIYRALRPTLSYPPCDVWYEPSLGWAASFSLTELESTSLLFLLDGSNGRVGPLISVIRVPDGRQGQNEMLYLAEGIVVNVVGGASQQ